MSYHEFWRASEMFVETRIHNFDVNKAAGLWSLLKVDVF